MKKMKGIFLDPKKKLFLDPIEADKDAKAPSMYSNDTDEYD
jgi:hypothetical protein